MRALLGFALLLSAACAPLRPSGPAAPALPRELPRIAVMAAFDAELVPLLAAARISERRVVNGRTHYLGTLGGQRVVLLLSGYSMVNAAMNTQLVLDRYEITHIVFSGIAGGVNPAMRIGDVTVPAQWGNYQEQVFARQTASGWEPARVTTEFANFGMMYPQGTSVTVRGAPADSLARQFWFPVDSAALSIAKTAMPKVQLERCGPQRECVEHTPRVIVGGNGVAGPTFVDNAAYREYVWGTFRADALDMESSAVAVVAYENRVPYIVFRGISDLAGGERAANAARGFGRLAAANAATATIAWLESLPPNAPAR